MTLVLLVMVLVALLAFANGANDNCKGVATLVGYGAATPRRALAWAAITTATGATVSFWLAHGLIKSFNGNELFAAGAVRGGGFFVAVLCGAFGWVIFATLTGMPVSTTHAITGALTGAGLTAFGGQHVQWSVLGAKFALPLALGPVLSLGLVYIMAWPVVLLLARLAGRCVCVIEQVRVSAPGLNSTAAAQTGLGVVVGDESQCAKERPALAVTTSAVSSAVHWTSSGMVGFARGWNDAPKIAALGLVALDGPSGTAMSFAVVAVAMALGGLVAGRKVLETLSRKVTAMPLAESLTASTTTAALVALASWNGLPVSTTHVSTGAIIGAGLKRDPRSVRWGKVGEIVVSWIVTLPVAALIAAAVALIMHRI